MKKSTITITNKGAQCVAAAEKQAPAKKGAVKSGGDLRTGVKKGGKKGV